MGLRGPKKGAVYAKTLARQRASEKADELAREIVLREWGPTIQAQAKHAQGVSYMVLRAPDGTFTRATDEKQIDAACAAGAAAFRIFTQAPNTQAFVALRDTAFGKPVERVEHSGPDGDPIELTVRDLLQAARMAAAKHGTEPDDSGQS